MWCVGKKNSVHSRGHVYPYHRSKYKFKYVQFDFEVFESLKLIMLKENFSRKEKKNSLKQKNLLIAVTFQKNCMLDNPSLAIRRFIFKAFISECPIISSSWHYNPIAGSQKLQMQSFTEPSCVW